MWVVLNLDIDDINGEILFIVVVINNFFLVDMVGDVDIDNC